MSDPSDGTGPPPAQTAPGNWRAGEVAGGRPDVPSSATGAGADADFRSALHAGVALVVALRRLARALRKLAAAELRVLRVAVPLLLIATLALGVFSIFLWACLLALFGWALLGATHSLGLALGLLVVINAVLAMGVASVAWYALKQVTLPHSRAELKLVGRSFMRNVKRVTVPPEPTDHAEPNRGEGT